MTFARFPIGMLLPRARIAVASQIAGLRSALEARGLVGLRWVDPTAIDVAELSDCEVLVGEPSLCAPLVDKMPRLKWMQSTFAGCNPLLDVSKRDYVVTRCAGFFGPDMAEYAAGHVLALEREFRVQAERQERAEWVGARQGGGNYRRLPTLTLGVLGLGDIGTVVARTFSQGFGMTVLGCKRRPASSDGSDAAGVAGVRTIYPIEELGDFLSRCDYIVSVLPSTPATRGLLDGEVLAACAPKKATLLNVGRGDLLSEATILRALEQGWLRHYVGDVFVPEPLPPTSALWAHPHVTVTAHVSAVTQPSDVVDVLTDNLARYEEGGAEALRFVFDWESGY